MPQYANVSCCCQYFVQVVQCRGAWPGLTVSNVAYASAVLGFAPNYLLNKVWTLPCALAPNCPELDIHGFSACLQHLLLVWYLSHEFKLFLQFFNAFAGCEAGAGRHARDGAAGNWAGPLGVHLAPPMPAGSGSTGTAGFLAGAAMVRQFRVEITFDSMCWTACCLAVACD